MKLTRALIILLMTLLFASSGYAAETYGVQQEIPLPSPDGRFVAVTERHPELHTLSIYAIENGQLASEPYVNLTTAAAQTNEKPAADTTDEGWIGGATDRAAGQATAAFFTWLPIQRPAEIEQPAPQQDGRRRAESKSAVADLYYVFSKSNIWGYDLYLGWLPADNREARRDPIRLTETADVEILPAMGRLAGQNAPPLIAFCRKGDIWLLQLPDDASVFFKTEEKQWEKSWRMERQLTGDGIAAPDTAPRWDPRGRGIMFTRRERGNHDVCFIEAEQIRQVLSDPDYKLSRTSILPLVHSLGDEMYASFSPNGDLFAFYSNWENQDNPIKCRLYFAPFLSFYHRAKFAAANDAALLDYKRFIKPVSPGFVMLNVASGPAWSSTSGSIIYIEDDPGQNYPVVVQNIFDSSIRVLICQNMINQDLAIMPGAGVPQLAVVQREPGGKTFDAKVNIQSLEDVKSTVAHAAASAMLRFLSWSNALYVEGEEPIPVDIAECRLPESAKNAECYPVPLTEGYVYQLMFMSRVDPAAMGKMAEFSPRLPELSLSFRAMNQEWQRPLPRRRIQAGQEVSVLIAKNLPDTFDRRLHVVDTTGRRLIGAQVTWEVPDYPDDRGIAWIGPTGFVTLPLPDYLIKTVTVTIQHSSIGKKNPEMLLSNRTLANLTVELPGLRGTPYSKDVLLPIESEFSAELPVPFAQLLSADDEDEEIESWSSYIVIDTEGKPVGGAQFSGSKQWHECPGGVYFVGATDGSSSQVRISHPQSGSAVTAVSKKKPTLITLKQMTDDTAAAPESRTFWFQSATSDDPLLPAVVRLSFAGQRAIWVETDDNGFARCSWHKNWGTPKIEPLRWDPEREGFDTSVTDMALPDSLAHSIHQCYRIEDSPPDSELQIRPTPWKSFLFLMPRTDPEMSPDMLRLLDELAGELTTDIALPDGWVVRCLRSPHISQGTIKENRDPAHQKLVLLCKTPQKPTTSGDWIARGFNADEISLLRGRLMAEDRLLETNPDGDLVPMVSAYSGWLAQVDSEDSRLAFNKTFKLDQGVIGIQPWASMAQASLNVDLSSFLEKRFREAGIVNRWALSNDLDFEPEDGDGAAMALPDIQQCLLMREQPFEERVLLSGLNKKNARLFFNSFKDFQKLCAPEEVEDWGTIVTITGESINNAYDVKVGSWH